MEQEKKYAVVDVTTNSVVAYFRCVEDAIEKARENPRDWMSTHVTHFGTLGIGLPKAKG